MKKFFYFLENCLQVYFTAQILTVIVNVTFYSIVIVIFQRVYVLFDAIVGHLYCMSNLGNGQSAGSNERVN